MAFLIWELECHEVLNLWNKNAIINKVKSGPQYTIGKGFGMSILKMSSHFPFGIENYTL
jgi:hypothetical protein